MVITITINNEEIENGHPCLYSLMQTREKECGTILKFM